ncbi:alpha/beta fold hydrolase [Pontivivens ytuae]|uniref:Alpha/beta fold hydrolase n=1 Tax=Pontivivens ytuae TaxID=2789856 RepID=A0A7S9LRN4_9RHOB|nr:alpha/beta fold hydrolase [Pontivivens ytuae]QPH54039.1 alpha/beta fold hydrolase [Pontivivens ytuae]
MAVELQRVTSGDPRDDATPLLIAHGLFGSARNWGAIAKRLSAGRQVIAVDMRNHGDSPRARPHDYESMADDLAAVVADLGCQVDLLGHSMGGKAAMQLALTRPELLRRLVVADIAPVAYEHSHMHHIEAMRSLDLDGVTRRSEADARLAQTISDAGVRAFLLQSLDVAELRWKLDLDALADGMPDTIGWTGQAGRFDGPALFLAGGASDYVTEAHRPAIREQFPDARFEEIEGAGHWLHAEQPRVFVDVVERFLSA